MIDNNEIAKVEFNNKCLLFNGYKPCKPYRVCLKCTSYILVAKRILLISLLGLGEVLMASAVLKPLKKKFPNSKITFFTSKAAVALLENNKNIADVISWSTENILYLSQMNFDLVINLDRSKHASALSNIMKAQKRYGFGVDEFGNINYQNEEFHYLYRLGLDDELRFKKNSKSMPRILVESLGLTYENAAYKIFISDKHQKIQHQIIAKHSLTKQEFIVGINTGCSDLMPLRKLPFESNAKIIKMIINRVENCKIILLGGKDEQEINSCLANIDSRVIDLTNSKDLSFGIAYTNICDVIISGCSFGLHLGIALGKPCIAWFGPSCEQEVELFSGGKKFKAAVSCSPCWQKSCKQDILCNTQVPLAEIVEAVISFYKGTN